MSKARIKQLRRCVLIHSILYHILDTPVVTDAQFDAFVKELNTFTPGPKSPLAKEFEHWDGKSGFVMAHKVDGSWVNRAVAIKNMVDRHLARQVE